MLSGWTGLRRARAVAGTAAMLLAGAVTAPAAFASDHNISISTADETPLERCDQVKVFFGSKRHPLPTARDERSFTLKGSETRTLQMHVEGTAGMALRGSKGSDYVVTACLAAAGSTDEKARASLGGIQVAFDAGRLSLSGPEEEENDWMVYFLVQVPDGSTLDLKADNGPIGLSDVSGTIRARTHNGPLELDGCEGEIDVAAENGPVSLRAGGGRQKVSVVNGPLAIELRGTRWDGDGIEADTKNGPLSLTIPERYESGVSLEMSGNGPIHCSNGCEGAWVPGHSQNLLFGSSHPVIHITTVNGPVEIDSGTKARRQASI